MKRNSFLLLMTGAVVSILACGLSAQARTETGDVRESDAQSKMIIDDMIARGYVTIDPVTGALKFTDSAGKALRDFHVIKKKVALDGNGGGGK